MKNLTEIDELTKSTRRYEFHDGLVDITYGVFFLALGLLCWFIFSTVGLKWYVTALVKNREITILGLVLVFSSLFLLIFGSRRIVERIRQSADWGLKGFVKPLQWQVRWPIQITAVVVSIAIIVTAFWLMLRGHLLQEEVLRFLVFSTGIGTGITYLGVGIDLKFPRYVYVGISGILASTIILFLKLTFSISWLYFGISWMIILVISGIYAINHYRMAAKGSAHE